jgi:serine/threonine-protein kinase
MFEQSLELEATFSAASNLGTILYYEGLYSEAAKAYETALEMNDSYYYLWGNLAVAYYYAPDMREKSFPAYEKAIETALAELEVNPNDSDVMISLGGYHARLGNEQQSLEYIRKALGLAPQNATILYLAGAAFETLDDRDQAIIHISKAIQGGYPLSEIISQPELKNLIDDPRFQTILENSEQ